MDAWSVQRFSIQEDNLKFKEGKLQIKADKLPSTWASPSNRSHIKRPTTPLLFNGGTSSLSAHLQEQHENTSQHQILKKRQYQRKYMSARRVRVVRSSRGGWTTTSQSKSVTGSDTTQHCLVESVPENANKENPLRKSPRPPYQEKGSAHRGHRGRRHAKGKHNKKTQEDADSTCTRDRLPRN